MSKYNIKTDKTIVKDGVEYTAKINKDVEVNFSKAKLTVKNVDEKNVELIPDSMDFLGEVTEIFPLSEYDIKITQYVRRGWKVPHPSLHLEIYDKQTGEEVYLAEDFMLSDKDYDYVRRVLMKGAPEYNWQTATAYLRSDIEACMSDEQMDFFTNEAFDILARMVSARYKEIKTEGYVDFECDALDKIVQSTLETILKNAYKAMGDKDE